MNKNINVNTKSMVANKMRKEMSDNMIQDALVARDLNNYETIKYLKANKKTEIELNQPGSVVRALARLGYVAGSMVGIITNLVEVSGVLMDNEYNTQFIKEDGTTDLIKLRKVFPTVGTKGNGEGYAAIFMEANNNIFLVENLQGRQMRLVKALKSDITTFVEQLEIVANKKADAKHKKDVKFTYSIDDYLPLDNAYDYAKEQFELFVAANPNASQEELVKAKTDAIKDAMKESLIKDSATELKEYMVQQQSNFIGQLVEMYELSNMRLFEEFLGLNINKDANAIHDVKKMVVIACEMIHNHFRYAKHMPMTKVDELAAKLRNAIYTLGEVKGLTPEETFRIACNAGWFKITEYKGEQNFSLLKNYRYTAISAMFSNELKWHFNADAMYSTIEVEIPDNFAIAPGTPFYMENGECEVELEDGSTDFMFCTEEDDYTGIVIAKVIGGEAVFVKYVNEYEFEQVEFLMFDNVCDLTQAANVYNANAATSEVIVNSVTTMTETNTNGMDAAEKELAEKADAAKLQKSFGLWSNAIELSVSKKDKYSLHTIKIGGKLHLNLEC